MKAEQKKVKIKATVEIIATEKYWEESNDQLTGEEKKKWEKELLESEKDILSAKLSYTKEDLGYIKIEEEE